MDPVAGPAQEAPPVGTQAPDDFQQLVQAAQTEGELAVIGLTRSNANYGTIFDAFSERYGIKVVLLDPAATSSDQVDAIRNGLGSPADAPDVVEVGLAYAPDLKAGGLSAPYKVRTWDSIPDGFKDPDGYWFGGYYGSLVLEVNTSRVQDPLNDWGDLLKPEFQGTLALTGDPAHGHPAGLTAVAAAGRAAGGSLADVWSGLAFFRRLDEAGSFMAALGSWRSLDFDANSVQAWWDFNAMLNQELNGPATVTVIPASGQVACVFAQGISACAPHPNAARLYEEFLFSDEGQLLWLQGHAHPARLDDLVQRQAVSGQLLACLPAVPAGTETCFPTPEELKAVREVCEEQWDKVVGVHIPYR
jgi:putative spermidine/putrescine transport system substrate-binding protein